MFTLGLIVGFAAGLLVALVIMSIHFNKGVDYYDGEK